MLKSDFINQKETLNYVLETGCSVSRFGDGEIICLMFGNWGITHPRFHQEYSDELRHNLFRVWLESANRNHLICVPPVITDEQFEKNSGITYRNLFSDLRRCVHQILTQPLYDNFTVGSSWFNRRPEFDTKDDYNAHRKHFQRLYENKHVIFASGEKPSDFSEEALKKAKDLTYLELPRNHGYSKYDEIFNKCIFTGVNLHEKGEDIIYHISAGPTASILAMDLTKAGFQALDLGQFDRLFDDENDG